MGKTNFFASINLAMSYSLGKKDYDGYEFLSNVNEFISTATFCNGKRKKQFLSLRHLKDNEVAEIMSCSESSVRRLRMETSNILYKLFGDKFFDTFYSGNLDECRLILSVVSGEISIESVALPQVRLLLPKSNGGTNIADVSTCINELKFLAKHSPSTIKKEMESLDKDKLAFILDLLDNPDNSREKTKLAMLWGTINNVF